MDGRPLAGMETASVRQVSRLSLKCELWYWIESWEISWVTASKLLIPLHWDKLSLRLPVSCLLLVLLSSWSSWIGPVTAWQCWSCISTIRAFEGTVRLRWHSCIIFDVKSSAGNSTRNSSALTENTKCWQRCGAAGTFIAGGNANWYNYSGKWFGNLE